LALILEQEIKQNGDIQTDRIRKAFKQAAKRQFTANIYKLVKTRIDEGVLITDAKGMVIFDSNSGKAEGQDYSRWRDVSLTLQGKYGARSTRRNPSDPLTSTLHVAAPLYFHGRIMGAVVVNKPAASINFFLQTARDKILVAGLIACFAVIVMGIGFSLWITHPIQRLTQYAIAVRNGEKAAFPPLGKSEIAHMGQAFEEMRTVLEGRKYIEQYVQNLTHELKSPLAAIQGAVELLQGEMPVEERERFLGNIQMETDRMGGIVEKMLQLSELENRRQLAHREAIDLGSLINKLIERVEPRLQQKQLQLLPRGAEEITILGEAFWLEIAILNLFHNAIDFSPSQGVIDLALKREGSDQCQLIIEDQGPGIPEYAQGKIFDKFFSLPRPDTGKKSTGLGLSLVKEIVKLHSGEIHLANRLPHGLRAELVFTVFRPMK
jgi:two-component system sensor histidine kinase CreC